MFGIPAGKGERVSRQEIQCRLSKILERTQAAGVVPRQEVDV
jgi:hypothetical protein